MHNEQRTDAANERYCDLPSHVITFEKEFEKVVKPGGYKSAYPGRRKRFSLSWSSTVWRTIGFVDNVTEKSILVFNQIIQ